VYEVGEHDDTHFIATEYIDGQTIRELIADDSLTLGETLDIASQLLEGLSAAHAAGIVHRDIKPDNVMRRKDGTVKILDFGIAKLVEDSANELSTLTSRATSRTELGAVLGTIAYVSPEQARGLVVDERTDLWSAGVVLYEMLAGRKPFSGATNADTIVSILERTPLPVFAAETKVRVLAMLQRVVSKALTKDGAARYQTAAEMLADLEAVKREIAIKPARGASVITADTAVTVARGLSAGVSSRRYVFSIAAIALFAILIAASVILYRRNASRVTEAPLPTTYALMNDAQRLRFISEQEQRVSAMMGEHPVKLNDEALGAIKAVVDRYAAPPKPNTSTLAEIYSRAPPYIPLIAKEFHARRIPAIIGIYLPIIESAYMPCYENEIGAKGLFQFVPATAELVLLSYNRGAGSVLEELRLLRETDVHYERNFWTLFANRDKLDQTFRNESAYYVPAFFAAAIIGENPQAFRLSTPPLSSLAR